MTVSELAKRLFKIMGKHGDLPVVGEIYIENKQVFLRGPDETEVLSPDDSEILSALLREQKDGRTTP
jgi:hypothetical protein